MKKKILKYGVIIVIIIILLTATVLIIRQYIKNKNNQASEENEMIENQVQNILSLDSNDENIIGYITIEELGIEEAPIADGTDSETISKYVGHFEQSSYLDGNVCLCSHNRGSQAAFFENLKNAEEGMKIEYITKYETKEYIVTEIKEIEETDLSVLEASEENKITLITCIENQKAKRLCVIGIEE